MVILALVGTILAIGAVFAVLKNIGNKATESNYTKLNIGQ